MLCPRPAASRLLSWCWGGGERRRSPRSRKELPAAGKVQAAAGAKAGCPGWREDGEVWEGSRQWKEGERCGEATGGGGGKEGENRLGKERGGSPELPRSGGERKRRDQFGAVAAVPELGEQLQRRPGKPGVCTEPRPSRSLSGLVPPRTTWTTNAKHDNFYGGCLLGGKRGWVGALQFRSLSKVCATPKRGTSLKIQPTASPVRLSHPPPRPLSCGAGPAPPLAVGCLRATFPLSKKDRGSTRDSRRRFCMKGRLATRFPPARREGSSAGQLGASPSERKAKAGRGRGRPLGLVGRESPLVCSQIRRGTHEAATLTRPQPPRHVCASTGAATQSNAKCAGRGGGADGNSGATLAGRRRPFGPPGSSSKLAWEAGRRPRRKGRRPSIAEPGTGVSFRAGLPCSVPLWPPQVSESCERRFAPNCLRAAAANSVTWRIC